MPRGYIQAPPDSSGKKVDSRQITNEDDSQTQRQVVVIGDPDDATDFFSLDKLRFDRQALEISMIESVENSVNSNTILRAHERAFTTDRRGASLGRGAVR